MTNALGAGIINGFAAMWNAKETAKMKNRISVTQYFLCGNQTMSGGMKVAACMILGFFFSGISTSGLATPPKLKCLEIGDFKEKVCRASMLELVYCPANI
jgi:hypothetical protein